MDIRKLCMEADTEVVADYIQMDTRRKGKYTYILCPGHEYRKLCFERKWILLLGLRYICVNA